MNYAVLPPTLVQCSHPKTTFIIFLPKMSTYLNKIGLMLEKRLGHFISVVNRLCFSRPTQTNSGWLWVIREITWESPNKTTCLLRHPTSKLMLKTKTCISPVALFGHQLSHISQITHGKRHHLFVRVDWRRHEGVEILQPLNLEVNRLPLTYNTL